MDYPYDAKTNKKTWLIRVGAESVSLRANKAITVYHEDDTFGTVSTVIDDEDAWGSVAKADYDAT